MLRVYLLHGVKMRARIAISGGRNYMSAHQYEAYMNVFNKHYICHGRMNSFLTGIFQTRQIRHFLFQIL